MSGRILRRSVTAPSSYPEAAVLETAHFQLVLQERIDNQPHQLLTICNRLIACLKVRVPSTVDEHG